MAVGPAIHGDQFVDEPGVGPIAQAGDEMLIEGRRHSRRTRSARSRAAPSAALHLPPPRRGSRRADRGRRRGGVPRETRARPRRADRARAAACRCRSRHRTASDRWRGRARRTRAPRRVVRAARASGRAGTSLRRRRRPLPAGDRRRARLASNRPSRSNAVARWSRASRPSGSARKAASALARASPGRTSSSCVAARLTRVDGRPGKAVERGQEVALGRGELAVLEAGEAGEEAFLGALEATFVGRIGHRARR